VRSAFIFLKSSARAAKAASSGAASGFASNQAEMVGALAENPSWWIERKSICAIGNTNVRITKASSGSTRRNARRFARTCAA